MPRAGLLFLFLVLLSFPAGAFAQDSKDSQVLLTAIEARIKKIEQDLQEVLVRQEKILEELQRLSVRVRRT